MDQNDANQNCHNSREDQKVDEIMEQEPSSSIMASMEISEETDSKIIAEDETTFDSHRQQSGDFQKESETDEIVRRVLDSFNDFQTTTVNNGENDELRTDVSYDHTSVIGRSSTSCAPGLNLPLDVSKPRVQGMTENNDKDANDIRIVSTRSLSTTESSTSAWTSDLKCENSLSSNGGFNRDEIRYAVLKEDDDWDIYQPGMVYGTESSLESRFTFQNAISPNEKYMSKNNSASSVDSDSCHRSIPYAGRKTNNSPSSSSANNGGTFPEWNEERMLKEVKLFFLVNPMLVNPLTDVESKALILTSPYFSMDFILKHGLPLPPTFLPLQELNVTTDLTPERKLSRAYEIILKKGISRTDFSNYFSMLTHRNPGDSPHEWYKKRELNPSVIQHMDTILDLVGPSIFNFIDEEFTARGPELPATFRDQGRLDRNIFWTKHRKCKEQDTISKYPFMFQKEVNSNFDDDNLMDTQTSADFPSTSSQTNVSSTPSLNASDSNSFGDADDVKAKHKKLKTSQSPMDLLEVQSIKSNDISETNSKKRSSILQSSNRDEEIRMSFDSLQGNSNKTNESPDATPIILPHIQNSLDQNPEEISRKRHLIESTDCPNGPHSSFQTSGEHPSRKAYNVLENILNVPTGVRKHILKNEDSKPRKKIRLQENSNTSQPEPKTDESEIKDESKNHSQNNWIRPRNKPCIIM